MKPTVVNISPTHTGIVSVQSSCEGICFTMLFFRNPYGIDLATAIYMGIVLNLNLTKNLLFSNVSKTFKSNFSNSKLALGQL